MQQMVKQRLAPAVVHLRVNGREVFGVLKLCLSDIQRRKAPLLESGRNQPIWIASNEQPHIVAYLDRLLTFVLDEMVIAGDQVLELALCRVIASPERLVAVQEQTGHEMRVEAAGDV